MNANIIDIIGGDRNTIPYRPEFRKITGSINSAILLQQIIFYCTNSKTGEFYKFKSPCNHTHYRGGDSWVEKLGFTEDEFETALKRIGHKIGKSKTLLNKEDAYVHYYTDKSRFTHYSLNVPLLSKALNQLYLVKEKSPFSYCDNSAILEVKEDFRNTIHTENTRELKTDIIQEEKIEKKSVAVSVAVSEIVDVETEEIASCFKPSTEAEMIYENRNLDIESFVNGLEKERQQKVKNLGKPKEEKQELKYFVQTVYFSDSTLFASELIKRFPAYEKYDIQGHYYNACVNWGEGVKDKYYQKADWILTCKKWIDKSVTENRQVLKNHRMPATGRINSVMDLKEQEYLANEAIKQHLANGKNGN